MPRVESGAILTALARIADIYKSRRVAMQLLLGYGSGLPYALTGETLFIWMKREGMSKTVIGLFAVLHATYTFKPLWAPLLDRYPLWFLGRRRGWILVFQLLLIPAIALMGTVHPGSAARELVWAAGFAVAFLSASLDIVVDAYRADLLLPEERAAGLGMSNTGYRVGMFVAGAGALWLADLVGWGMNYAFIAPTMLLAALGTLLAPEPERVVSRPRNILDAYVHPLLELLKRPGAWIIILFVFLFKFGYALAAPMNGPFLVELGFSDSAMAFWRKTVGVTATFAGTLLAGPAVARFGIRRSLLVFGAALALVHLSWAGLAYTGPRPGMLAVAIVVENIFIGLASTAFEAYFMALCNSSFSASQYTVLSSLSGLGRTLFGASSGALADRLGWPLFFGATSLIALPALLLVRKLPRIDDPADAARRGAGAQS